MREWKTNVQETGRQAPDGRKLERVTLGFELKSLSEDGTGDGFLSVFGNEDSYGDVVDPGAFTKTIAERNSDNPLPFLWQHYSDEPIGIYTDLRQTDHGLYTKFQYALKVQRAQEAYELAKLRAVKGQSIGFTTIKDAVQGDVRHLQEVRLWEGSQVTFPANDLATITSVKDAASLSAAIERLSAQVADIKATLPGGAVVVDGVEGAAVSALLADIKSGISAVTSTTTEPDDVSTREARQAVADLRREMTEFLQR